MYTIAITRTYSTESGMTIRDNRYMQAATVAVARRWAKYITRKTGYQTDVWFGWEERDEARAIREAQETEAERAAEAPAFHAVPVFGLTYANRLEAIYQHKAAAYEALMQREQTAAESAALMETCTADWYWLAKTVGADWQADVETARLPVELDAERHVAEWNALTAEAARAFAPLEAYDARRDGTAEEDGADLELQPCVRCGQAIAAGPVNVCEPCSNGRPPVEMPPYSYCRHGIADDETCTVCDAPADEDFEADEEDRISPAIADGLVVNDEGPAEDPANYATEAEYYGGLLAESMKPAGAPLTALEANGLFDSPILDEVTYGGATVPAIVERALPDVLAAAERLCDDVIAGISPELQAVYERPVPAPFGSERRIDHRIARCKHGYATDQFGETWCAACRIERAGITMIELPPVLIPASDIFQGADAAEFGERVGEPAPRRDRPAAHPIAKWLSEEARRVGSDLREQLTRLGY